MAYCWAVLKPSWTFALLPWPQDDQSDHKIPSKSSGGDAEREWPLLHHRDCWPLKPKLTNLIHWFDFLFFFPFSHILCLIFPPISPQSSSSKRSLLPTVPPLEIKPPQWHHKTCIVTTLSPYLLLSTVEGTFSHFPFNMIMKTDFWLSDHLLLVTYPREIKTSYPIKRIYPSSSLAQWPFLGCVKLITTFQTLKKKITFKFNMKMCRMMKTHFGNPILVIKNRWKGCTKAKKIEN